MDKELRGIRPIPVGEIPSLERLATHTERVASNFSLSIGETWKVCPLTVLLDQQIELLGQIRNRAEELGW